MDKYILLYSDYVFTRDIPNIKIIRLLLNSEEKNNSDEIYPDIYTEESLIENALCVIYLSKINRSEILIASLRKYNKLIIDNEDDINLSVNILLKDNLYYSPIIIDNFEKDYLLLTKNNGHGQDHMFEKNISISYDKIDKIIIKEQIYMITYYKKTSLPILNVIQKKCIIENLKNKNIEKVIVIGYNLKEDFKEEFNDVSNKLILNEYDKNVSYKYLLDIVHNLQNKIICIIRSDIILPNQTNLDELEFDLIQDIKQESESIYSISRIDRLVNGNLVRSEKLNKILSCTEQDALLFKSPINIKNEHLDYLDNLYFYNKHSELYFNRILKINNYNIINNTNRYNIIRIHFDDKLDVRQLLDNPKLDDIDNIFLLPDNDNLNKISIDKLLSIFNIDSNEVYKIKCELFNRYLKNKIINEINM